jgi:hypothetical protein
MSMQDLSRNMVAPEFLWWGPIYDCTNLPIDQLPKKMMVPPSSNQPIFYNINAMKDFILDSIT